jgi:hypothetical protein
MDAYTYKCVAAPRRAKKTRDHRTPAEALVAAVEAVITEQAAAGWEYLRTDLVPMETKSGWMGPVTETHQGVMVFRRRSAVAARFEDDDDRAARLRAEPVVGRPRATPAAPEVPKLGAARIE